MLVQKVIVRKGTVRYPASVSNVAVFDVPKTPPIGGANGSGVEEDLQARCRKILTAIATRCTVSQVS